MSELLWIVFIVVIVIAGYFVVRPLLAKKLGGKGKGKGK